MADGKFETELKMKPFLIQTRKIGGRVVQEELIPPTFDEDEALEGLLQGVDADDVEEGRDRLLRENPHLASQNIHEMLDISSHGSLRDASEFSDPVRETGVKRAGKIALKDTGDTITFRRIEGGRKVSLLGEDGAEIEVISALEFDGLLGTGDYVVL